MFVANELHLQDEGHLTKLSASVCKRTDEMVPTAIRVVCRHICTITSSSDDDISLPIPVCPRDYCTEV